MLLVLVARVCCTCVLLVLVARASCCSCSLLVCVARVCCPCSLLVLVVASCVLRVARARCSCSLLLRARCLLVLVARLVAHVCCACSLFVLVACSHTHSTHAPHPNPCTPPHTMHPTPTGWGETPMQRHRPCHTRHRQYINEYIETVSPTHRGRGKIGILV